jgi:hypothetical protein
VLIFSLFVGVFLFPQRLKEERADYVGVRFWSSFINIVIVNGTLMETQLLIVGMNLKLLNCGPSVFSNPFYYYFYYLDIKTLVMSDEFY